MGGRVIPEIVGQVADVQLSPWLSVKSEMRCLFLEAGLFLEVTSPQPGDLKMPFFVHVPAHTHEGGFSRYCIGLKAGLGESIDDSGNSVRLMPITYLPQLVVKMDDAFLGIRFLDNDILETGNGLLRLAVFLIGDTEAVQHFRVVWVF